MDRSNPELYKQLMTYIEEASIGLDAFSEAQKVKVSPLRTTILATAVTSQSDVTNSTEPTNNQTDEDCPFNKSTDEFFKDTEATPINVPTSGGLEYELFKIPLLFIVLSILLFELACYGLVRLAVATWEDLYVWRGTLGSLREKLKSATTYEEWKQAALALDSYMKKDKWRKQSKMAHYDNTLITALLCNIREYRHHNQTRELAEALLQGGLKSNVGNIDNSRLYSHTYYGTKHVVEKFIREVDESLDYIGFSDLPVPEKKKFFQEAYQIYGRTALCLSGGATLAYFHFGVVKALLDKGALPSVITGTSAGAMIASMIACRTDEELREVLNHDLHVMIASCGNPFLGIRNLFRNGVLYDTREFTSKWLWVTKGHTTFLEAYQQTGKILNITAVPYSSCAPAKMFNYLSTPNVVIWSAFIASASLPGILDPITIMTKNPDGILEPYLGAGVKWRDGSINTDIPVEALKLQFNVTYTIVSQANPHISVFYYEHRGSVGRPPAHRTGKGWRGGFLVSSIEHSLKLDLLKWLRVLRDLELLPFIMKQDFSNVWLQNFSGTVNILPTHKVTDLLNIISDPDLSRMKSYFKNGAIRTWPKLHMINNRMRLEKSIIKWLETLHVTGKDHHVPAPHLVPSDDKLPADRHHNEVSYDSKLRQMSLLTSPVSPQVELLRPSSCPTVEDENLNPLMESGDQLI